MIKFKLALIGLLFATYSYGADITTTTCPGAGCVNYNVGGSGSAAIQVTGTWVGTITFQATVDNSTYVSLRAVSVADTTAAGVTTTTGNGAWNVTVTGINQVRVVFTSWMSGTASVTFRALNQAAKFGNVSSGTLTSIATSSPITGGPITGTGTIACATCGVTTGKLSQFAATSSSELAGVISDESGSGLLVFATAPTLTNFITSSTAPTVANVGMDSCGTTAATIAGNNNVGAITVGATGGTQCRIAFSLAAPTRRHCVAVDETTAADIQTTYVDTTHTDILGTLTAADVVSYLCMVR